MLKAGVLPSAGTPHATATAQPATGGGPASQAGPGRPGQPARSSAGTGASPPPKAQRPTPLTHVRAQSATVRDDAPVACDQRTSLLDVIRDKMAKQGKTSLLYRVVMCGEITKELTNKADLGAHYQRVFKQHQTEADLVTGILLVFSNTFLHVVEAAQKTAIATLLELHPRAKSETPAVGGESQAEQAQPPAQPAQNEDGSPQVAGDNALPPLPSLRNLVRNVRLVYIDEDCEKRAFPFWASRVVEAADSGGVVPPDAVAQVQAEGGALARTCVQLALNMADLGARLSTVAKNDLKTTLDALPTRLPQYLPSPDVLLALSRSDDAVSVEEWADMMDAGGVGTRDTVVGGSGALTLEGDLVWPAATMSFF